MRILQIFVVFVLSTLLLVSAGGKDLPQPKAKVTKSLATLEPLLLVSTLDGSLHSVSSKTGAVKWKIDESPVINIPRESTTTMKGPTFLPDPHDGSLYAFEPSSESITKLPFTIQELVKASPLRTVEGILYTGRKEDVWYGLDPLTGKKQKMLTTCKLTETCETSSDHRMYIGRSEYQITMYDTKNEIVHWNVTFADYSSHINEEYPRSYDHLHLTSSADGYMVSVDRKTGKVLWAQNYGYPVVAIYAWQPDGGLYRLELTSVADATLMNLLSEAKSRETSNIFLKDLNFSPKENALAHSLYIGQYKNGLYALPALTHSEVKLNRLSKRKMLPGPDREDGGLSATKSPQEESASTVYEAWRVIGYHKPPPLSKITLPATPSPSSSLKPPPRMAIGYDQLDPNDDNPPISVSGDDTLVPSTSDAGIPKETDKMPHHFYPLHEEDNDEYSSSLNGSTEKNVIYSWLDWIKDKENQPLWLTIIVVVIITCISVIQNWLMTSRRNVVDGNMISRRKELGKDENGDRWMQVGQIRINMNKTLGSGSQGTVVYRGIFDDRKVAIKRIVSINCTFADREVALLRESDRHLNVVRYYCTEKDPEFQYIALELCRMTLKEYVENKDGQKEIIGLDAKTVLHQAMQGLHHLHQLKIVHRDVKPSNILISDKNQVVLSDFGLCKKVRGFDASFSAKSGMAGTQGWIAPELLQNSNYRMTQAVDIFSMGCVFHYVIGGKHPFGDVHERQYNIISGRYDLNQIKDYEHYEEAADIIRRMISIPPNKRPKTEQILAHPLFWDPVKTLQFFEDVSDRVEKETDESKIVRILDRSSGDNECSVAHNWQERICKPLQEDLKKFRTYRTDSVKDLLRAIRNKKHHYEELPEDVKSSLGPIPTEFLTYFISRFPSIVIHTYLSMAVFQQDIRFKSYYGSGNFVFEELASIEEIGDRDTPVVKTEFKKYNWTTKTTTSTTVRTTTPSKYRPPTSTYNKSPADLDMNWRERKPLTSETNIIKTNKVAPPSPRWGGRGEVKTTVATVTPVSYAHALVKSLNVEPPITTLTPPPAVEEVSIPEDEDNEDNTTIVEEDEDDDNNIAAADGVEQIQPQATVVEEAKTPPKKHKKNRRHKKKKNQQQD